MTTRISKTPARVATITTGRVGKGYRVFITGGPDGRAPISLAATDADHAGRMAAALRGYLADAYLAGRDSMAEETAMLNEPLKGMPG